jgi:hypothetical protein
MPRRSIWIAVVVVLSLAIGLQGCELDEKVIKDRYSWLPAWPADVPKKEIELVFPRQYCIPQNTLEVRGWIQQKTSPPPSGLGLRFVLLDPSGSSTIWTRSFTLSVLPDGRIPKQTLSWSMTTTCITADHRLQVFATPFGYGIDEGAAAEFELGIPSLPVTQGDLVQIFVKVTGPKGSSARVDLDPPDIQGQSQCGLPGPPKKPAERFCSFFYPLDTTDPDNPVPTSVTFKAVADRLSKFEKWKDLCGPFGGNPVCTIPVFNFDEVTAQFKKP